MTLLFVTYAGDFGTRFDRDYYVANHLPLVLETWEPHGLKTIAAFFRLAMAQGQSQFVCADFRTRRTSVPHSARRRPSR